MKIIKKLNYKINLPNELEIELSLIDSGMVITEIESEIAVIIKDSENMISGLVDTESAKINFTYIDRPEFPAINSDLKLRTKNGLSVKYSCFFNTEAEYDLNLLRKLLNQREIYLYFLSDMLNISVILHTEDREKEILSGILEEFNI